MSDNQFDRLMEILQEILEALAGAESADIGKLDTADKSGKVNRVDEGTTRPDYRCDAQIGRRCVHQRGHETDHEFAGSAETGGEKAAPCKCVCLHWPECNACKRGEHISKHEMKAVRVSAPLEPEEYQSECKHCGYVPQDDGEVEPPCLPTFHRSPQNQTASSGVEGAHEGTTADEKGDSREPEKLNNAHMRYEGCSFDCGHDTTIPPGAHKEGCRIYYSLVESSPKLPPQNVCGMWCSSRNTSC